MEEVQTMLRTNKFTRSKDMKLDDDGEDSNISKGRGGNRGNRANSKSDNKSNANASSVIKLVTLWILTNEETTMTSCNF